MKRFVITAKGLEPLNAKSIERAKKSAYASLTGIIPEEVSLTAKEWYEIQVIIGKAHKEVERIKDIERVKDLLCETIGKTDEVVSGALRRAQKAKV